MDTHEICWSHKHLKATPTRMKSVLSMPVKVELGAREAALLDAYLDHSRLANCESTHCFIKALAAGNAHAGFKLTVQSDRCHG